MAEMIHIDGTMGEGGGQVLRGSLTLALLSGRAVRLTRIRARRDRPGLGFQHRMAVHAAARISSARVEGDRVGSQDLEFVPGPVVPGDYHFDIGTAGNTSLVLQTVLLPLALARGPSTVGVTGGTHVPLSPCFHYLDWHWRVMLSRLGLSFDLGMITAGFYPQGGGEIHAAIPGGARIDALNLCHRGRLLEVHGLSAVANLPEEIAQRQRGRALRRLRELDCPARIVLESMPARSQGTVLVLLARFEHGQACFFALGARGKRAERVADEAVDELLGFLATGGAVDRWLADQLLLPLACAGGPSAFRTSEVTLHLLTHAEVIRRFLPVTIRIDGELGEPGTVHVKP
ncbi:RNA 3'-terminal phosphate cyclase [Thioalkalivibrio thiocyanodenitrificans]|uniref:RNA 3'-terminal phosphate cyclase n=1 Tax=Thioalkalivibrio thiocyanodenitrificans TaxID=243063 RepID=UPI00036201BB|nr:RNA 3'-terminal phosphate cyclase [Thioalkalivibrio thiocyanodenitrificans]